jgi:hypothetical protein
MSSVWIANIPADDRVVKAIYSRVNNKISNA